MPFPSLAIILSLLRRQRALCTRRPQVRLHRRTAAALARATLLLCRILLRIRKAPGIPQALTRPPAAAALVPRVLHTPRRNRLTLRRLHTRRPKGRTHQQRRHPIHTYHRPTPAATAALRSPVRPRPPCERHLTPRTTIRKARSTTLRVRTGRTAWLVSSRHLAIFPRSLSSAALSTLCGTRLTAARAGS